MRKTPEYSVGDVLVHCHIRTNVPSLNMPIHKPLWNTPNFGTSRVSGNFEQNLGCRHHYNLPLDLQWRNESIFFHRIASKQNGRPFN